MNEATMTDADMAQRENIVKSMKKKFKDFRKRYGANAKNVMYATATKMAMKEAVKDEADKGEYDYEGDMAKSSLRTIARNAEMMHGMLGEDTNLPEWVASKITLAEDYIVSAAQYMQSEMSEEVELDEISKELAWKAAHKASEKTRVAAYGSIYGRESGHKRFLKAVRQHKKISDYASAKTPKVPYVKEEEQIDEYQKGLFNPPSGFTKKGIEKGGGVKTTYHYKGKSNKPSGATMKMGGVSVPLGKTPTKRRIKEDINIPEQQIGSNE